SRGATAPGAGPARVGRLPGRPPGAPRVAVLAPRRGGRRRPACPGPGRTPRAIPEAPSGLPTLRPQRPGGHPLLTGRDGGAAFLASARGGGWHERGREGTAMDPEQLALLRRISDEPDDDTARLVYADWLEEHGEAPAAGFIRAQVGLERAIVAEPDEPAGA